MKKRGEPPTESCLIQIQFEDKEKACDLPAFRRLMKGSGAVIDTTYPPQRVAPGRFVGRGTLTKRAAKKFGFGQHVPGAFVTLFKDNIKIEFKNP